MGPREKNEEMENHQFLSPLLCGEPPNSNRKFSKMERHIASLPKLRFALIQGKMAKDREV